MKYEITMQRPNGNIEKTTTEKFEIITPYLWERFKLANKKAGTGTCLSYLELEKRPTANMNSLMRCCKCGRDGRLGDMRNSGLNFYHRDCTN